MGGDDRRQERSLQCEEDRSLGIDLRGPCLLRAMDPPGEVGGATVAPSDALWGSLRPIGVRRHSMEFPEGGDELLTSGLMAMDGVSHRQDPGTVTASI